MDRNSFSYALLVSASLASFLHLSWMTYNGKFTFSLIGMVFIIVYGLLTFSEYEPSHEDVQQVTTLNSRSANKNTNQNSNNGNSDNTNSNSKVWVQYRQFSRSGHHHLSSHRFQVDSTQPECDSEQELLHDAAADDARNYYSTEFAILEFCVFLLSCSFFTTDLFFAYQIFDPDLNYIPLVGGALNVIPALYIGSAERTHDLFIFTIPANCWGQVFYGGFKHNNVFAILAGYLFFVAYYYNAIQRVVKGVAPRSQSNYYMSGYCVFASLALHTAYLKFGIKVK